MATKPQEFDLNQLDMNDAETRSWVGQNIDFNDADTKKWYETTINPPKTGPKEYGEDFVFAGDRTPFEGLGGDYESQYASLMQRAVTDPSVTEKDFDALAKQFAPNNPGFQGSMDKYLSEVRAGKQAPSYEPVYGEGWDEYIAQRDRGASEKFYDGMRQGVLEGFGDTVIRAFDDWTNIQRSALEASNPGQTDEWYEENTNRLRNEAERTLRDEIAARQANDPMFDPAAFVGGMLGSVGPEMILPAGSGALGRILMAGSTNAAADAVYQARDISNEQQDEFSPERLAMNTLLGVGLQGALEVPGAISRGLESRAAGPEMPEVTPSTVERVTPQTFTKKGPETVRSRRLGEQVQEIANAADTVRSEWTNAPETTVRQNFNDLGDEVDANALGVFDAENGRILLNSEAIRKEADFRKITPQEMTKTVLFHEGLGHYGLSQKFRDDLDASLDNMYRGSKWFQSKVDQWIADNPTAYLDDPSGQTVRAADEVLAELSERGRLPNSIVNNIKNKIKEIVRAIPGMENLQFTKREIETILAQAHSAVINGKGADVRGNGFRSMTRRDQIKQATAQLSSTQRGETQTIQPFPETESDYYRFRHVTDDGKAVTGYYTVGNGRIENLSISSDGGPSTIGAKAIRRIGRDLVGAHEGVEGIEGFRISGARPTAEFAGASNRFMKSTFGESKGVAQGAGAKVDRGRGEVTAVNRARSNRVIEEELKLGPREGETFEQWIEKAEDIRMTQKMAESLAKGAEAPEVLAASKMIVRLSNTVADLRHKVADGTATPHEMHLFARAVEKNERIKEAVADVVANASRIMLSRKIEVGSDEKLRDSVLRKMMASNDRYLLDTPEGRQEFARKLVKNEKKAKLLEMPLRVLSETINFGRSMQSTLDVSGPFRQGFFLIGSKAFWKNYPSMYRMLASQKYYDAAMDEIRTRPTYPLMKKAKLRLTEVEGPLSAREEKFQSQLADYVPGVKASNRAYSGFLNKLSADTFDSLVRQAQESGVNVANDPDLLKSMASFANAATGRGNLGNWEAAAQPLATGLFSPRLIASRLKLLNPATYIAQPKEVRQAALKNLLVTSTLAATVLSLAKMAGAEVEMDPRSSDFLKAKVGNTRYDLLGGFGQYLTLGARLGTNETKNSRGVVKELGEGYKADTRLDVLQKFFSNKAAPAVSFVFDYLRGANAVGEEPDYTTLNPVDNAVMSKFLPLLFQDMKENIQADGWIKGVAKSSPAIFGVGVQTYDTSERFKEKLGQEQGEEVSPAMEELIRLNQGQERDVIQGPPSSFQQDKVKYELDDEMKEEWAAYMGDLIQQYVAEDMETPEYQNGSDEEKREIVKKARSDAYLDTKIYFLDKYWPEEEEEEPLYDEE